MTQRALVAASLADGASVLGGPCVCDDTRLLVEALRSMGVGIDDGARGGWEVTSRGVLEPPRRTLMLGNAGTAVRFLGALSTVVPGEMALDGSEAMRRRPQEELMDALGALGVGVECTGPPGRLPAVLRGPSGGFAGTLEVSARVSSQHLSGLLMAAPRLPRGLAVTAAEGAVSRPYVRMTVEVMRRFGVEVRCEEWRTFRVAPQHYAPARIEIEGDASSAAMLLAAGRIAGREVVIENAPSASVQGDAAFPAILEELGASGRLEIDMKDTPDAVPPAAAVALFRDDPTVFVGVSHLRAKESNRLGVLSRELGKLGARLEEGEDELRVIPSPLRGGAELDPEGDHRMAMTFALVGLRVPGVVVKDPGCVSKSFPGFFGVVERFR